LKERHKYLDKWSSYLGSSLTAAGENITRISPESQASELSVARDILASIPGHLRDALNKPARVRALVAAVFLQSE